MELASFGVGLVSPNPLVGCVVVSENGEVVGEGSYIFENVTHAEMIALEQAGEKTRGGTAYVSLEPHDHHGRTAPCTDALINAGIKRVVCPIEDPNPLVSGRGFEKLRNSGVEVVTGILADEAAKQNEKFIIWHKKKRPFLHLKMAMSIDGRISLNRSVSIALSGEAALKRVHKLRHEYDAILVGGNTALVDNPNLTDRSGKPRGRKLVRIVLDNRLRLAPDANLTQSAKDIPTLLFTNSKNEEKILVLREHGVEVIESENGGRDLAFVLNELRKREIQSVLVEGGAEVAGAFCDTGLVDKITFIAAPIVIGGDSAPHAIGGKGADSLSAAMHLRSVETKQLGGDLEITGYPIFGSVK